MKCRCKVSYEQYVEFCRLYQKHESSRRNWLQIIAYAFVGIGFLSLSADWLRTELLPWLLIAFALIVLVHPYLVADRQLRRAWAEQEAELNATEIEWSSEALQIHRGNWRGTWKWSEFTNVIESHSWFMLYKGKSVMLGLCKSAFDDQQLSEFRDMLLASISKHAQGFPVKVLEK